MTEVFASSFNYLSKFTIVTYKNTGAPISTTDVKKSLTLCVSFQVDTKFKCSLL